MNYCFLKLKTRRIFAVNFLKKNAKEPQKTEEI